MIKTFVSFYLCIHKHLRGVGDHSIVTVEYELGSLPTCWSDDTGHKG